jgi:hypothetical protein
MVRRTSSLRNVSANRHAGVNPKGVAVAHSPEFTTAAIGVQAQTWPVYRDGIFWSRQGLQHGA